MKARPRRINNEALGKFVRREKRLVKQVLPPVKVDRCIKVAGNGDEEVFVARSPGVDVKAGLWRHLLHEAQSALRGFGLSLSSRQLKAIACHDLGKGR